jgi:predicted outer membrane repeat protein
VQSNQTTSGAVGGGGVLVASGTANFVNTTFLNNESQGNGGAIACTGDAVCSLFNVTVENNKADSDSNASGFGGGVSTTSSGVFTLSNSILHHNTVGAVSPTFDDCNGSFVSSGTNILTGLVAGHCQVTGTTSAEDPKTGLLNQNGGETATLALTTGSPAIDAGLDGCPDQNGTPLTVDQRGAHRPTGAACDLGAYEFEANGDVNGDGTRDVADVFALINFLFAGSATPPGLGDADGNVVTDVADVFYLINFLFAGGPAPL